MYVYVKINYILWLMDLLLVTFIFVLEFYLFTLIII